MVALRPKPSLKPIRAERIGPAARDAYNPHEYRRRGAAVHRGSSAAETYQRQGPALATRDTDATRWPHRTTRGAPMPSAYWVTWYRAIRDQAAHAKYAALAGPAIQAGGGRFLVRGMSAAAPEGTVNGRAVVVEFQSLSQAVATYESPEYQAALAVLGQTAEREVRIFEGADPVAPA